MKCPCNACKHFPVENVDKCKKGKMLQPRPVSCKLVEIISCFQKGEGGHNVNGSLSRNQGVDQMKLDITEEELEAKLDITRNGYSVGIMHNSTIIGILKELGITFKQPIDWEADTHDPSVIPESWLVERWDDYDLYRQVGFHASKNNRWNNYRAIKKEDWPKWAVEAHKCLED